MTGDRGDRFLTAEIISVGTELLLGETVNTNARVIAACMAELGIDVYHHVTVGDNLVRLQAAIGQALARADVVITTGGLGPTMDDITREGIAQACGVPLCEDSKAREQVEGYFRRRNLPFSADIVRQWHLPRGARPLPNENGSAPPFILEHLGRVIIALPGPPREMEPVLRQCVLPFLKTLPGRRQEAIISRVLRVCGMGEARVEQELADIMSGANPTVAPYAHPGEVRLRITTRARDEESARLAIEPLEREIRRRLGWRVFGAGEETLELVLGKILQEKGMRLAVAESCTGGLVCHRITNIPGSSGYFPLGVVVYANEAKEAVIGVPAETLKQWGAVSRQTAEAMARGVRRLAGADIGVSITGIAGPGGATPIKPVGTVYFGLATSDGVFWRHRIFPGDRETVKQWSAQEALTFVWDYLHVPERLDELAEQVLS